MEENVYTILKRVNSRESSMMSETDTQRPKKKSTSKKKKLYQMKNEQIQENTCCWDEMIIDMPFHLRFIYRTDMQGRFREGLALEE